MNALMRAREIYAERKFARRLDYDLRAYLQSDTGVVISAPEWFGMAHPVKLDNPREPLERWWDIARIPDPNAWFVLFAIGSLKKLMTQFPYPLEYVCYHRRGYAGIGDSWHCVKFTRLCPHP